MLLFSCSPGNAAECSQTYLVCEKPGVVDKGCEHPLLLPQGVRMGESLKSKNYLNANNSGDRNSEASTKGADVVWRHLAKPTVVTSPPAWTELKCTVVFRSPFPACLSRLAMQQMSLHKS